MGARPPSLHLTLLSRTHPACQGASRGCNKVPKPPAQAVGPQLTPPALALDGGQMRSLFAPWLARTMRIKRLAAQPLAAAVRLL
jgi:hypothetical protein